MVDKTDSFDTRLYNLPLDLKIKIYQMSVQENMVRWLADHQESFTNSLSLINRDTNMGYIDLKGEYKDGFWVNNNGVLRHGLGVVDPEDSWYFSHVSLCDKTALGYEEVYIPRHFMEQYTDYTCRIYRNREWVDQPDYHWYSTICRCNRCDKVKEAKKVYEQTKSDHKSERCTRILRECTMSGPSHRYIVERAIEIVENHYLNDSDV